jgi:hypothetical protein
MLSYALYNLAVLLEEEERKKGAITSTPSSVMTETDLARVAGNRTLCEIRDLYRRAYEADQRDADIIADYGRSCNTGRIFICSDE